VPRGTTSRCRALTGSGRSQAATTAFRDDGRSRLRLLRVAVPPRPVRAGARGGCSPGHGTGSHRPGSLRPHDPATRSRRCRYRRCYTPARPRGAPLQPRTSVRIRGRSEPPNRR